MNILSRIPKNERINSILMIFSSVLFMFCFTTPFIKEHNIPLMGFICFVPLLWALEHTEKRYLWRMMIVSALSMGVFIYWWSYVYAGVVTLMGVIGWLSVFWIARLLLIRLVMKKFKQYQIVLIPLVWIGIDAWQGRGLLGGSSYLAFPWGFIGYSQYSWPSFAQFADIVGIYGVSFVLILIQVFLYEIVSVIHTEVTTSGNKHNIRVILANTKVITRGVIITAIIVIACVYGSIRMHTLSAFGTVSVGLIQPNINTDLSKNVFTDYRDLFDTYYYPALNALIDESQNARLDGADIIVWPETSIWMTYNQHTNAAILSQLKKMNQRMVYEQLLEYHQYISHAQRQARDLGVFLFMGTLLKDTGTQRDYNSYVVLDPNMNVIDTYSKMHLVPFGEWFPYSNIFPWLGDIVEHYGGSQFSRGEKYSVFSLPGLLPERDVRVSALVCFEGIFSYIIRRMTKKGAVLFVNGTNDYWTHSTAAEYFHALHCVFRAIETKRSFVRSGNSGITCYINPFGKIEKQIGSYKQDYLVADAALMDCTTLFTRFGDWFAVLCLYGTILFVIFISIEGIRRKRALR